MGIFTSSALSEVLLSIWLLSGNDSALRICTGFLKL